MARKVVATWVHDDEPERTEVTIDTGSDTATLTGTDWHPVWEPKLGLWVPLANLQAGSWLQTSSGTRVQVTEVRSYHGTGRVHDLTVEGTHNYHVVAGGVAALVHNCGPDIDTAAAEAAKKAPEDATMTSVARIKDTDMTAVGYSGPSSRPVYLESEIRDAIPDGEQTFAGDAANCAEIRACNALFANHAGDFEEMAGRPLQFNDIEFLTVRSSTGFPAAACLSCQSVLVRRGATDLATGR